MQTEAQVQALERKKQDDKASGEGAIILHLTSPQHRAFCFFCLEFFHLGLYVGHELRRI